MEERHRGGGFGGGVVVDGGGPMVDVRHGGAAGGGVRDGILKKDAYLYHGPSDNRRIGTIPRGTRVRLIGHVVPGPAGPLKVQRPWIKMSGAGHDGFARTDVLLNERDVLAASHYVGIGGIDDAISGAAPFAPPALPALPPASLGAADPLCPTNACGLPPAGNYAPSALAGIGSPSLSAVSRSMRGDGLN